MDNGWYILIYKYYIYNIFPKLTFNENINSIVTMLFTMHITCINWVLNRIAVYISYFIY